MGRGQRVRELRTCCQSPALACLCPWPSPSLTPGLFSNCKKTLVTPTTQGCYYKAQTEMRTQKVKFWTDATVIKHLLTNSSTCLSPPSPSPDPRNKREKLMKLASLSSRMPNSLWAIIRNNQPSSFCPLTGPRTHSLRHRQLTSSNAIARQEAVISLVRRSASLTRWAAGRGIRLLSKTTEGRKGL